MPLATCSRVGHTPSGNELLLRAGAILVFAIDDEGMEMRGRLSGEERMRARSPNIPRVVTEEERKRGRNGDLVKSKKKIKAW